MRIAWLGVILSAVSRNAKAYILAMCAVACMASPAAAFPDRYDRHIRAAAHTYLPGVDWRLWKAQLYQESLLKPDAVSPVGAAGLAQFMPATWREVVRGTRYEGVAPTVAEAAIDRGAYYMARLRRGWSSRRPEEDRLKLAQASYNAGFGSLLKAQRKCGNRAEYRAIMACLPQVTGHHSKETTTYVRRIWKWFAAM